MTLKQPMMSWSSSRSNGRTITWMCSEQRHTSCLDGGNWTVTMLNPVTASFQGIKICAMNLYTNNILCSTGLSLNTCLTGTRKSTDYAVHYAVPLLSLDTLESFLSQMSDKRFVKNISSTTIAGAFSVNKKNTFRGFCIIHIQWDMTGLYTL